MDNRNPYTNLNSSASFAALVIEEKKTERMKRELAEHRFNLADEHIVKLTQRSKDLLYEVALKSNKFETLIKRMKNAYPAQEVDKIAEGVEQEYNNDPQYLKELREATDSQPVLPGEEKVKSRGRSM